MLGSYVVRISADPISKDYQGVQHDHLAKRLGC